ncbi:hypothetical protein ACKAMS_24915 [Rhodococcus sp. 5A-K4]|uniref:hypothetical protein n=1 Tax=Rhodococcus sp. 5A-K4 TaxID=3384442 RepID=UPI0038D436F6
MSAQDIASEIGAGVLILGALVGAYTALTTRWKAMLDAQREAFEAITRPMQDRLHELELQVAEVKIEARTERHQKLSAFEYIRQLFTWGRSLDPAAIPPPPPPIIAQEL